MALSRGQRCVQLGYVRHALGARTSALARAA